MKKRTDMALATAMLLARYKKNEGQTGSGREPLEFVNVLQIRLYSKLNFVHK